MQGGGVGNYKRGGSNCNGVDGGKITATITVYYFKDNEGKEVSGVKKEDAERLFNEILSVDPEKYTFYQIGSQHFTIDNENLFIAVYPCDSSYNQRVEKGVLSQVYYIGNESVPVGFIVMRTNKTINYNDSNINGKTIVDAIPDTVRFEETTEYTFYYRKR